MKENNSNSNEKDKQYFKGKKHTKNHKKFKEILDDFETLQELKDFQQEQDRLINPNLID
jgi:hypothetical protein